MKVILMQNIRNVGKIGEVVNVKPGFGRNFLIPQKKAVSATPANLAKFEAQRADIERAAKEAFDAASARATQLQGKVITILAKTGDEGRLFGSIGTGDIAKAITDECGIEVARREVMMPNGAIRQTGEYLIDVQLHSEVNVIVKVIVAADM